MRPDPLKKFTKAVGGVFAIAVGGSVQLFTLGSASRRIPHKEWEIPVPAPLYCLEGYDFYPGSNVIAFVKLEKEVYVHRS